MAETKHGFVLAAGRPGNWFYRSFHATAAEAIQTLRRTIDADALHVFPATVRFGSNGGVRIWQIIGGNHSND